MNVTANRRRVVPKAYAYERICHACRGTGWVSVSQMCNNPSCNNGLVLVEVEPSRPIKVGRYLETLPGRQRERGLCRLGKAVTE